MTYNDYDPGVYTAGRFLGETATAVIFAALIGFGIWGGLEGVSAVRNHYYSLKHDPVYREQFERKLAEENKETSEILDKALSGMGKYFVVR